MSIHSHARTWNLVRMATWVAVAASSSLLLVDTLAAGGGDRGGGDAFGSGFTMDWHSIDGGGGVAAEPSGAFSLIGSIGQADAGTMAGGTFTLTGGFLAIEGNARPPCLADLDRDGAVGPPDLAILLGAWGNPGGAEDLSGNGAVGPEDIGILLGSWGPCV